MIRRSYVMSAAVLPLAFALAACGGGDDNATPSPSPTPSASPTPTSSPSYGSFPLTAAGEFVTITASTSYTGDLSVGPVTLGAAGVEARSDRVRVGFGTPEPTAATTAAPWVIRENTGEARFSAGDLTAPPTPTAAEFSFRQTPTPTPTTTTSPTPTPTPVPGSYNQADFLNNLSATRKSTDPTVALTRVTYVGWQRADSLTGTTRFTSAVYGYPTLQTDLPTTGVTNYTGRLSGKIIRVPTGSSGAGRNEKLGGTVTISVNWATGLVTTTLNATVTAADGTQSALGTFTGTGAIAVGASQFNGSFGAGSPVPGTIQGSFFGNAGIEIGVTFAGLGPIGGDEARIVGAIVGTRTGS